MHQTSIPRVALVALALLPAAGVLLVTGDLVAASVALALGPVAAGGAWAAAHRTVAARDERLAHAADRIAAGDPGAREGLRRGGLGRVGRALDALGERVEELSRRGQLLEAAAEGTVALDHEGRVVFANPAAAALLGAIRADLYGELLHDVVHRGGAGHAAAVCPLLDAAHERRARRGEDAFAHADGGFIAVEYTASPLVDLGEAAGVGLAFRDVSERRRLDDRLRHADRMEAVAQLAAGVAHDFNNLLAVVLSCAGSLRAELPEGEARRDADEIARAARRGAALVQQLLAFGRRPANEPRVLDPNAVVLAVEGMLRRAIGEGAALELALTPDAGHVRVDPGRLEGALVALVLHARDATPAGGRVRIATAPGSAAPDAPHGGPWVLLEVSDTGEPLPPEARARLFEPLFSTRGDRGGLGLSTVYGFVKQAGGEMAVESAPGRGTALRMFLPRAEEVEGGAAVALGAAARDLRGRETVLVLDDDARLRAFAGRALGELGYTVLEAASGEEAAALVREHAGPIHLLLVNVALPRRSGVEVADDLRRRRPELAVLYSADAPSHPALERARIPSAAIVARPFHGDALAERVRAALGRATLRPEG
jgi:PAS domain S-box-containing protein